MPPKSVWDDPNNVAVLKACIDKKMSSSQTACHISGITGLPLTRNACLGAANRRGWQFDSVMVGKHPRTSETRKRASQVYWLAKPKPVSEPPQIEPDFLGLTFWELPETGFCKYPHGESNFTFCGQPAVEDTSWCPYHTKICTMRSSHVVYGTSTRPLQNSGAGTGSGIKG